MKDSKKKKLVSNETEQVIVDGNWYVQEKSKLLVNPEMDSREVQIKMMKLMAKKDRIEYKLGKLDPSKKKDSKQIVAYNVKLKDIEAELRALQDQSGINIEKLDHGSKLGRFVGKFKKKVSKAVHKVKHWYHTNKEIVNNFLIVTVPVAVLSLAKCVQGWLTKLWSK